MPLDELLEPRSKDIGGGFTVRRLLPTHPRQGVGPFVFFDHFGPITTRPGDSHDVRPHPHIGLATVTYLFEGAILHRDNIGSMQRIEPGAINWMTAGRGIVHSERSPTDLRDVAHVSHGLQLWAALPKAFEDTEPGFCHTAADAMPEWHTTGIVSRVLIGEAFGLRSPVQTYAPTLYLDVIADPGATLTLVDDASSQPFERGVYSIGQPLTIDGTEVPPFHLAVLANGPSRIAAPQGARYVVIGGEPLDGPRIIWWNFVTSSAARLEEAKADWAQQRMPPIPGDSAEWIPLP